MAGWEVALRLTGLGWYVVVCLVGGTAGGKGLDKWLDTDPILTLVGLLLGIVMAFFGIYRMITPILASSRTPGRQGSEDREQ